MAPNKADTAKSNATVAPAPDVQTREPVSPPSGRFVNALPAEDQILLDRLLNEPCEYMSHPDLSEPGADLALYGVESKLSSKTATRFIRPNPLIQKKKRSTSRMPTLTTEQEKLLFLRFNYARKQICDILEKNAGKTLTADQGRKLLAWGHRMLATRAEIVQFNLPLVPAMAKRTRLTSIDYNELISEGNVALLRAVEKFDCGRGFKFSTYGCRAILKAFSRVAMRASRYRGRFPVEFDPAMEKSDFLEQKRDDVETDCVSELKRILLENSADLNDVEQKVIRERFAITGPVPTLEPSKPKTLEEVGTIIGVTKERVRQIQNRALQKIRVALEHEYLVA
jgi:RNA polymerase sigma factor (sigma-70 family)